MARQTTDEAFFDQRIATNIMTLTPADPVGEDGLGERVREALTNRQQNEGEGL